MDAEYILLIVFCGVVGIGVAYAVVDSDLIYGHLGWEQKLCEETIQGSVGWNKSPYTYLECSYDFSSTVCRQTSIETRVAEQYVKAIEQFNSTSLKITTSEGINFIVSEDVDLGDIVVMSKSWNEYEKNYTQITSWDLIDQYHKEFMGERIMLEARYHYKLDDFDHPKTLDTYKSFPNYCKDATEKSIHYELLRIERQ